MRLTAHRFFILCCGMLPPSIQGDDMPLTPEQCYAFLAAAVLITLSPGPDNLMVLSVGIARGRGHGIAFGLGCALGCLSHTLLATLGVSALIAASPIAFSVLKIVGGVYLLWLGFQALRSSGALNVARSGASVESPRHFFAKGLIANAINPKVIIFFLSFLPQFVSVGQGAVAVQTALLGVIFTLQAAMIFGVLGYFSGAVGQWLSRHARAGLWLDRAAGIVFVGLGARLIVSR